MNNLTFAIIKPDAIKNKFTGKIYNHILSSGFEILGSKLIKMSKKRGLLAIMGCCTAYTVYHDFKKADK